MGPLSEAGSTGVFAHRVIEWQRAHGRHRLPWQNTRDPYRVWLSEIMLQQTQVATVLGYYDRFLQRFPDVFALAAASSDDVLALWSGLGYYSRARNLHRCAQAVAREHGGRFPPSAAQLQELPGIGRSTAAAIAAFCFGERVAILDGNVKRVVSRVLGFGGDLSVASQERALWNAATGLLPEAGVERYTQGLMDLGATICLARQPLCTSCPVQSLCVAKAEGEPQRYPVKTRRLKRSRRESVWIWLQWRNQIWLSQRPDNGVWAQLWSLPEVASQADWQALCQHWPGTLQQLPSFTHVLTHLDWTLHPVRCALPDDLPSEALDRIICSLNAHPGRWLGVDEALLSGLPAPLKRLISSFRLVC